MPASSPVGSSQYLLDFEENGRRIRAIKNVLVDFAQSHHQKEAIENLAQKLIKQAGGEPAFAKVPGYQWATCINVNDQIVHTIPKGPFKPGDLVTIDVGMFYRGTTTDTATSFVIGAPTSRQQRFLEAGRRALNKAINQVKPGKRVKAISGAIQTTIERSGYQVVRTLTGHGLGPTMHEPPVIPCFIGPDPHLLNQLKTGMVLAIEVMYTAGSWQLVAGPDNWTLKTRDGSLSAVFEDDVIVTPSGCLVIT